MKDGQLWPYLTTTGVYHCPADLGPFPPGDVTNLSNYCMNGAPSGYTDNHTYVGFKITKFHPDDVLYWELPGTKDGTNGANDSTNWPTEGVGIRHNHSTTVSHMDGHADLMTGVDYVKFCADKGPNVLWCSPVDSDGGGTSQRGVTVLTQE